MKLGIIGASGVTGGEAFGEAERRGLEPIAVGRNGPAFRAFCERNALAPDRIRIADATDAAGLRKAFSGLSHVVSTVAPFGRYGFEIARVAAETGLGYTDSTGETRFMLRVIERLDAIAVRTGATICTGNGVSAFAGDVATRWLAPADEPASRAVLLYDIRRYTPTWGSLESYLTSIVPGGGAAIRDGNVVLLPFAAFAARIGDHSGVHGIFPDALVISRYWRPDRLDVITPASRFARPLLRALAAVAVRPAVRRWLFRLPLRSWLRYRPDRDAASVATVSVAITDGQGRSAETRLRFRGIYAATGRILVATAQAMARRDPRPAGVRAASEMFVDMDEAIASSGGERLASQS